MNKKLIKKTAALTLASVLALASVACTSKDAAQPSEETIPSIGTEVATDPTIDLSGYSFDTVYGSQLINFLDRQYYFDGEAIPLAEANFYFAEAFYELTNYATYGLYPLSPEGYIDLSAAPYDTESGYDTYGDFLMEYAERMLESTYVICDMAEKEGVSLSDETLADIDEALAEMEANTATPAGMTLDEYTQLYYGASCDAQTLKNIFINYKLADLYTLQYIENYEFDEEELMIPNVRYALFAAPEGTDETTLADAEAAAQAVLEASTDLDQLEVQCALAYTNGTVYDTNTLAVEKNVGIDADFEEWAYEEHEVGDIEVIYAPAFGYFVIGYLGETELPEASKQDIAVQAFGDYITELIDNGTYEFYSNDPKPTAEVIVYPAEETVVTDANGLPVPVEVSTQEPTGSKAYDILMIVFASIGGAAVITGIITGVYYAVSKNKKNKPAEDSKKEDKKPSKEKSSDEE